MQTPNAPRRQASVTHSGSTVGLRQSRRAGSLTPVRRLVHRPRRLRRSPALRNLVRETNLTAHDFILPLFISAKIDRRRPIASMPGVFQFSVGEIVDEAKRARDLGLQALLLFGIPEKKDEQASGAYADDGVVQQG